ncbi:MAG: hypothetical protein ACLQBD_06190 [Syntrophobacteraceae bacterium]
MIPEKYFGAQKNLRHFSLSIHNAALQENSARLGPPKETFFAI